MQSHPSAGRSFTKNLEILSLDFYRRDTKDAIRFLRNAQTDFHAGCFPASTS